MTLTIEECLHRWNCISCAPRVDFYTGHCYLSLSVCTCKERLVWISHHVVLLSFPDPTKHNQFPNQKHVRARNQGGPHHYNWNGPTDMHVSPEACKWAVRAMPRSFVHLDSTAFLIDTVQGLVSDAFKKSCDRSSQLCFDQVRPRDIHPECGLDLLCVLWRFVRMISKAIR